MRYFWDSLGIILGYFLHNFWIFFGYLRDINRTLCQYLLESFWDSFGILFEYFWILFGHFKDSLGYLKDTFRILFGIFLENF